MTQPGHCHVMLVSTRGKAEADDCVPAAAPVELGAKVPSWWATYSLAPREGKLITGLVANNASHHGSSFSLSVLD